MTNGRVPVGKAGVEAACPLLDASRSYVVFGGNPVFSRKLLTEWMDKVKDDAKEGILRDVA